MIRSKFVQSIVTCFGSAFVTGMLVLVTGCNSKSSVEKSVGAQPPKLSISASEPTANNQTSAAQGESTSAPETTNGLDAETKLLVTDFQKNMQAWRNGRSFDFGPTAARIVKRLDAKFDLNEFRLASEVADRFVTAQAYDAARRIYAAIEKAASRADNAQLVAEVKETIGPELVRLNLLGTKPKIEGTVLGGGRFDWSKYKGKVVLLDFWATWCGPCVAELPNVVKAYDKFHAEGFEVVGISLDDDHERLANFLAKDKLPWTILFDEDPAKQGWEGAAMTKEFAVNSIPATFLIDRAGKVVSLSARDEDLEPQVKKLLSEKP